MNVLSVDVISLLILIHIPFINQDQANEGEHSCMCVSVCLPFRLNQLCCTKEIKACGSRPRIFKRAFSVYINRLFKISLPIGL